MPLIVEDGTGKVDAQTFANETAVSTYWTLRGGNPTWTSASPTEQAAGCVIATDFLAMEQLHNFRGVHHPTARLPWPRIGATVRHGPAIAENTIPWQVPEAVCLLAPRAIAAMRDGTSLMPPAERGGGVKSESGAGFSTTYFDNAPAYTVQQDVIALLTPLLRDRLDTASIEPVYVVREASPADNPAMLASTFANPGAGTLE